ncbi:hypothetical protein ElyMa_001244900 [Elysia marginata]|uniref:Uncharacterized protein n=1 Tax=Elysia marginata TaxID=1093978 RepID=A0AAV4I9T8_9GAST|nr:hypothetical protein ElyMa_001244900 [Elysia marginata]
MQNRNLLLFSVTASMPSTDPPPLFPIFPRYLTHHHFPTTILKPSILTSALIPTSPPTRPSPTKKSFISLDLANTLSSPNQFTLDKTLSLTQGRPDSELTYLGTEQAGSRSFIPYPLQDIGENLTPARTFLFVFTPHLILRNPATKFLSISPPSSPIIISPSSLRRSEAHEMDIGEVAAMDVSGRRTKQALV